MDVCFSLQLPRDWLQEKEDAAPSSGEAEEQNLHIQTEEHSLPVQKTHIYPKYKLQLRRCICASDASGASSSSC